MLYNTMLLRLSRVTLLAEQPQANVRQNCTALESLQVTAKNSKLLWAGAYIQVVYCGRFGGINCIFICMV